MGVFQLITNIQQIITNLSGLIQSFVLSHKSVCWLVILLTGFTHEASFSWRVGRAGGCKEHTLACGETIGRASSIILAVNSIPLLCLASFFIQQPQDSIPAA